LQDSLGGNSKTLMFVNCGPSQLNVAESINSLNFASRAKSVALGKATKNREGEQTGAGKASATMAAASKLGQDGEVTARAAPAAGAGGAPVPQTPKEGKVKTPPATPKAAPGPKKKPGPKK